MSKIGARNLVMVDWGQRSHHRKLEMGGCDWDWGVEDKDKES